MIKVCDAFGRNKSDRRHHESDIFVFAALLL